MSQKLSEEQYKAVALYCSRWKQTALLIAQMRLVEGKNNQEVAEKLKVTTGLVSNTVRRFLKKQEEMLADNFKAIEAPIRQYKNLEAAEHRIRLLFDAGYIPKQIQMFLESCGLTVTNKELENFLKTRGIQ